MRKIREHADYQLIRDHIKDLFRILRQKGFIARMNYYCCGGCAHGACLDLAKAQSKNKIVFYHRQGEEDLKYDGSVFIYYSSAPDAMNDELTKQVGEEIIKTARVYSEIKLVWDGDPHKGILVKRNVD